LAIILPENNCNTASTDALWLTKSSPDQLKSGGFGQKVWYSTDCHSMTHELYSVGKSWRLGIWVNCDLNVMLGWVRLNPNFFD